MSYNNRTKPGCDGCKLREKCVFLFDFSVSVYEYDVCPCSMCIIKMMCGSFHPCEEYNEFWRTIYRRRLTPDRYNREMAKNAK